MTLQVVSDVWMLNKTIETKTSGARGIDFWGFFLQYIDIELVVQ